MCDVGEWHFFWDKVVEILLPSKLDSLVGPYDSAIVRELRVIPLTRPILAHDCDGMSV